MPIEVRAKLGIKNHALWPYETSQSWSIQMTLGPRDGELKTLMQLSSFVRTMQLEVL